ncbi:DUF192 domain-containing protein [Pistricoccus aurantiacus]|uniref:DUF192 domain-containing protein n=1 Tax=Pistricoccus aurantiacus TaxID=1883414 RepID=A0A5B8SUT3_9GAMM|nr:DUF192 domain-containing protein [Pistricoccus aurantiacus]QEA40729.1 DUF192 domain-containing protein [Pistricoccus aurantiacus]
MRLSRRRLLVCGGVSLLAPLITRLSPLALAESLPSLETDTLVIHSAQGPHRLEVELARNSAQQAQGLMGRSRLAPEAGMLFLYTTERSAQSAFWMYRTLIPLDIAFIDSDGRIAAIRRMEPCQSQAPQQCPTYEAGVPYLAALEVNAGYFEERDIHPGDCISLPGVMGSCVG